MRDMFYVYALHSIADNGFYIGFTADLKRRVSERLDAEGRERYLKSGAGRLTSKSIEVLPRKVSASVSRVRPKAFYAGCLARIRTRR
jgi:predicted GIY-YIG superfamily endonuclease